MSGWRGEEKPARRVTAKAIEATPFLLETPRPKKIIRTAELISSRRPIAPGLQ